MNVPSSIADILEDATGTISNTNLPDASFDMKEQKSDDYINEAATQSYSPPEINVTQKKSAAVDPKVLETMNYELEQLRKEKSKLEESLGKGNLRIQTLLESEAEESSNHQQEVSKLLNSLERMEAEKKRNSEQQARLQRISDVIKSIEYSNIQKEVVLNFFTPKYALILDHLKSLTGQLDASFADRVPRMSFVERGDQYIVTVVGFADHHNGFNALLKRIRSLLNVVISAKAFYQRDITRIVAAVSKNTLAQVPSKTKDWRDYVRILIRLLEEEKLRYSKKFQDYIEEKSRLLVEQCVTGQLTTPWVNIRKETDIFIKNSPLMNEIDAIKSKALDEFIRQSIIGQRVKLDAQPTVKSATVLQNFIDGLQKEFVTDRKYQGSEVKHFSLIPKLLQRLMLYYGCFKTQLPLFESSKELLDKIDANAVTTISTSTGSGKRTLSYSENHPERKREEI